MRYPARMSGLALAVGLLLAACGSSSSSATSSSTAQPAASTSAASGDTVKTTSSSQGTILVDANGMTLYHLSGEQGGKFICTSSACAAVWHPLTVTAGSTPSGGVGSLGTVKRPDGTTQVTYNGTPVYTFAQDRAAGETNGQGIKDVGTWTVITTGSASSTGASSSSSSEGGGTPAGAGSSESSGTSESGGSSEGGYKYSVRAGPHCRRPRVPVLQRRPRSPRRRSRLTRQWRSNPCSSPSVGRTPPA